MKKFSIPVSQQLSLPAVIWESISIPATQTIVFLHGFTNHCENYAYLGEWFSQKGFDFIAYDHRDHGSSPLRNQPCSIDDMVNDARAVIYYAYESSGNKQVLLMGSSMGGALSILASQGEMQELLSGLVLWAPQVVSTKRRKAAYSLLSFINKFIPEFKIPSKKIAIRNLPQQCNDRVLTDKMSLDNQILGNPSISLLHRVLSMGDLASQAKFDAGFKVFMLLGGKDKLIFKHDVKKFVQRLEEEQVNILYRFYPENHHMLWGDINREMLYNDVLGWISQN